MSFPAHLVPSVKSAYRSIFRAARVTFIGDRARRVAFQTAIRQTFSSPTLTAPTPASASSGAVSEPEASVSEEELVKRIEGWQEVAQFLKKNVVQGVMDDSGSYQLRVTEDTELGENTSIKTPPKLPTTPFPNRNRRRKCGDAEPSST